VWDDANMRVTNVKGLEKFVREPARKGWDYGREVWRA
jgi:hypothetical protein